MISLIDDTFEISITKESRVKDDGKTERSHESVMLSSRDARSLARFILDQCEIIDEAAKQSPPSP